MTWIKMRGALLDHPKTIAVSRELHNSKPFREWLTPGGSGPMNEQVVGDAALRCVTVGLLLRVWSVSREHGKFDGNDLVLEHSEISDLDQMAGAPGVGAAMEAVGWAIATGGVTLPNFKEFNVPMTAAEKQREYRRRQSTGNETGHGVVTPPLPDVGNVSGTRVEVEKNREGQSPARAKALATGRSRSTPGKRSSKAKAPLQTEALGVQPVDNSAELSVFGSDPSPGEGTSSPTDELVLSGDPPARGNGNGEGKTPLQAACAGTWQAYAYAYERRWGAAPLRSAKANSQVLAFCKIVPADEAPAVAAFFVESDRGLYVSSKHDLALLSRDAAGLRTEWATGHQVKDSQAKALDAMGGREDVYAKLIREAEEYERAQTKQLKGN